MDRFKAFITNGRFDCNGCGPNGVKCWERPRKGHGHGKRSGRRLIVRTMRGYTRRRSEREWKKNLKEYSLDE